MTILPIELLPHILKWHSPNGSIIPFTTKRSVPSSSMVKLCSNNIFLALSIGSPT